MNLREIKITKTRAIVAITIGFCLTFFYIYRIEAHHNGFCNLYDYLNGKFNDENIIKKECRLKLMKKKLEGHHGARYRLESFFYNLKPNSEVLKEFDEEEINFMCNTFDYLIDSDINATYCKQRDINKSK